MRRNHVVSLERNDWQATRLSTGLAIRTWKGERMELSKFAPSEPILAKAETTVLEAVTSMASKEAGAVVIVNSDRKIQGIFTECDNVRRVTLKEKEPRATPLGQVMTAPVMTVNVSASVDEALSMMIRNRFGYLPVVDADNRIVGILSRRDLLMRRIGEKEAALQTLEAFASAGGPG
jgi:CBS domain-containing protein